MMNPLSETAFEAHITSHLANSPMYCERTSRQFDIDTLCDHELLEQFLRAQPLVWQGLERHFPGRETEVVVQEINRRLNREEGLLGLLQCGIILKGIKVRLLMPRPVLGGTETDAYKLYQANRFAVVRQMRYSTDPKDAGRELDLCILVNGRPLMTLELKNEATGQHCEHGIYQYRHDRSPQNRMLRNCLVHFVLDNSYAFMTTRLEGEW